MAKYDKKEEMTVLEKMEYEAIKRLEWFIDGYCEHNLGESFSRMSTEDICELYSVNLIYFRPWLKHEWKL
jgi:hypothetical protein